MMAEEYLWALEDWLDPDVGGILAVRLLGWDSIAGVQV